MAMTSFKEVRCFAAHFELWLVDEVVVALPKMGRRVIGRFMRTNSPSIVSSLTYRNVMTHSCGRMDERTAVSEVTCKQTTFSWSTPCQEVGCQR